MHAPESAQTVANGPNAESAARPSFCFMMPYHIEEGRGGGAEVQAWFLARELAARGYRTWYVAQSVTGKAGTTEVKDGVTLIWLRPTRWFHWANAVAYYRALSRANCNYVVQRMTNFMTGVAALWCQRNDRLFVWICSDNEAPVKGTFVRKQRDASRSAGVSLIKRATFAFNARLTEASRNWAMPRISHAFTQNDMQRDRLTRDFGLSSHRMISGHPVPEDVKILATRLKHPKVIWAGNFGANKRPAKFVELARLGLGSPFQFVIIGSRTDSFTVKSVLSKAPENLTALGRLPLAESEAVFDTASFLVNTSISEGFPNTFIQAWLRGIPVVSLAADPDNVITKHGLGYVGSDLNEALRFMTDLAADPEAYARISARVSAYAAEHHTIAKAADHFLAELRPSTIFRS